MVPLLGNHLDAKLAGLAAPCVHHSPRPIVNLTTHTESCPPANRFQVLYSESALRVPVSTIPPGSQDCEYTCSICSHLPSCSTLEYLYSEEI